MSDFRRWALAAAIALAACGDDEGGQGVVDEGEAPVPGCTDATTSSGALTRVCFPAEWNGDLILYAHGYVQPDEPLAIPDDLIGGTPVEDLINAAGYAYGTTSYRANGLVADLAVDDLVQLKELVRRTVRPDPVQIFIVGVSEGGLVAALAAEAPLDPYAGVLAACGPIGDFARQIDYFNDVRVVFDYLFPGVIPGSPIDPPAEVRADWDATYAPAVVAALSDDPAAALELAEVTGVPAEGLDPGALGEAVAGILWYNVLGSANAQQRLGGQPYDNVERSYLGSSDDAALNAEVARFIADGNARAELVRFETTGQLTAPISIIHTTGDPIVPFFDVERFGHCALTSSEILAAFGALPQ